MPPLQKRPPNQPKVPKVKIPKDPKPTKAKAEIKPESKVKAKPEPKKAEKRPEKLEKPEKKPEKSKFSLWKRSSSRSRSVEKGEEEDGNVNSLRVLAEHPVFQVKERGTVGNERGKDGGFGRKEGGIGMGMGMEKRRKSDELRREKPSPLNLSPVTPPPNKEHRFSIASGKSEKRGSVGSEKRESVGSGVSVGSGKAAYVPTHAASDFLRSATAGPEEKGRGSLDSGGSGRSRSLDGRRGSFDGKRGSFDWASWGREEKGSGKWGRDERGRRVMPVSPGLRRYNEDVREGRYAAGKG